MLLAESERNRRSKMREAHSKVYKAEPDKDFTYSEGFFGPGFNPFSSSHDRDMNGDF